MPDGFDAQNPPFDRLSLDEVGRLRASIDIGYFAPGEVIVAQGKSSDALHVIIKGSVEERDGDEIAGLLGPKDSFDSRALVHGAAGQNFTAAEETLCYLLPKHTILELVRHNQAFAAFFYSDVSRKFDALTHERKADGVEAVLRARIREARHADAVYVDGSATVEETGHRMRDADTNALFVRDAGRIGMVTGMNLSKAVVLRRLPLETPVRDIAHFDLVAVDADDFIFDALIVMTRHNKRRVAIRSGENFVGILEDIDILGLFAGNSQLIPGRIDRARSVEDSAAPARDIQAQVERLHRQGLKIEVIAEITSSLNRNLFAKLFELTAPPSIRQAGSLLVMGSEGRGEQTVRTDQDNALLLADEVPAPELAAFREGFSGALELFGFPPCPGNVMVRNPLWSQPVEGLMRELRLWSIKPSEENTMNLGIFFDAVTVAGRPDLVDRCKLRIIELMRGESVYLAHFAHLVDRFEGVSLGVLNSIMASVGVGSKLIDIKKAGTFPIVHGMRTLAIDEGILATATAARIEQVVARGILEDKFGRELAGALRVFMEMRLRSQLRAMRLGAAEEEAVVRLDDLTTTDRDLLRDALRVVKQFRELIGHRYNLRAF